MSAIAPKVISKEASELDFDYKTYNAPIYRFNQVTQTSSGGSALTLTTSNVQSIFTISPGPINLSRTYITLDLLVPANGVDQYTQVMDDCLPLDSIQLKPAVGQLLIDLQNAQPYTKVCQMLSLSMKEYMGRGPVYGDTAMGAAYPISQCSGCNPSWHPQAAARVTQQFVSATPTSFPNDAGIVDLTATPADADQKAYIADVLNASHLSGSDVEPFGPQHWVVSGANAAMTVRFRIPLGVYYGTLLAVDKSIDFGQNLQLTLNWKPLSQWGFSGNVANLATNAAANLTFTSLTNYYLYVAKDVSRHSQYISALVAPGGKGLRLIVPYLHYTTSNSSTAGAGQICDVQLTNANGEFVKRVITIPCNNDNTRKLTANNFNVNSIKWSQVQSSLNDQVLQDQPLVVSNSDVWNYAKHLLRDCPQGMSQRTFDQNALWIDNFSDCDSSAEFRENDTKLSGLPIFANNQKYTAKFTTVKANGLTFYQYIVYARVLVIKNGSIMYASPGETL
jgi:hypothetical protein